MNIIEAVRALLAEFPRISEVCNAVHVDFAEPNPDSYALSSTGDALVNEDVLGNQRRQHNFVLYTMWQSASDFDRLNNAGILLELTYWLERHGKERKIAGVIDGVAYPGEITKLTCSNGMLMAIPPELNGGVQYQLQIAAEYKINMED